MSVLPNLSALSIESTDGTIDPLFKKQLAERQNAAKKAAKARQRAEPKPGVTKKPPRGGGGRGRGGGAGPSNDHQRDEPRVAVHDDSWDSEYDDMEDDSPGAERKSVEDVIREFIEKSQREQEQAPRRAAVAIPPPSPIPASQMDSPPPTPPPSSEEETERWKDFKRLLALNEEEQAKKERVLEQKEAEREREMEEPRKEYERLEAENKADLERRKAAARAAREAEYADQMGGVQGPDAKDLERDFEKYEPQ
jgi:hypothetical protein